MTEPYKGFFAIALTPFTAQGDIIWSELERECSWIARGGSRGVVWPVNNSEFTTLSHRERVAGFEVIAKAVGGRIPFVAGVHDTSKHGAVDYAEAAKQAGAGAVIAIPPYDVKMANGSMIKDYYGAIAEAAELPVFIQNLGPPVGSNLSASFMAEIARECPLVRYVKEEREPHGPNVDEVLGLGKSNLRGVFTGSQILGVVDSYLRGAQGNMASSELADIYAQIWELMEIGDVENARRLQALEANAFKVMRVYSTMRPRKEILVRRGIFSGNYCRNLGTQPLDSVFMGELSWALKPLEPYYRV
jgi:dihydrodipicolinate synthase/N-acetylneuraminate lyase